MEKKLVSSITAGALVIAVGFVFLMDDVGVAFGGAVRHWYLVLLVWAACQLLAVSIIYRAPLYCALSITVGGVFLALSLDVAVKNVEFSRVWPIVPLFFGLGILIANAAARGKLGFIKSAAAITVFSVALLIGALLNVWQVVLPAVVMAGGILIIISGLGAYNRKNRSESADYYVTPTKEEESKDEGSDAAD